MKGTAALLLFVVATSVTASTLFNKTLDSEHHVVIDDTSSPETKEASPTDSSKWNLENETLKVRDYVKPLTNPKEALLQEIRSLDEEAVLRQNKAQKTKSQTPSTKSPAVADGALTDDPAKKQNVTVTIAKNRALKKLVEAEDMGYDDDDNLYDDLDDEDEEDETTDEEYGSDEDIDDEQIMTQCPDYCRCTGQYAPATTAICTKLVENQSFGPRIAHLRIENAGEISLGPHAFRSRGLQHLESIMIADTRIVELDRRAFDGTPYLFAVNLTNNALQDIHPQTFQNNSQLSLITIIGNPLKHYQNNLKGSKHYLLDAPSVAEFDFSNNGITKLPRAAFQKMQGLAYVSLKGNKLKELENGTFDSLESLVELDLSDNLFDEIPAELLRNTSLQTLRISGNNLTTLETIKIRYLAALEAANNKIKVIAKDDLAGVPVLEQLTVKSNELKRIHQHAFVNLDQLTYLDVSDNKLTSWTEHHLRNNPRLQILLMNDNPALASLPVFKTTGYEFQAYSVYRFECSNCGLDELNEKTFDAMPALTRLKLSKNRLAGLPNGLLKSLSSLRDLDLSDNLIDSLDPNMFHGATTLNKINLAGNPLVTLQTAPFLMTPGLTRLDVSRCELERVWSEARSPLKSLKFLSLRGNQLRRITVEELRATPKLSSMDLSHNPLDCDDDFNVAIQWLTDHGVTPTETGRSISNYGDAEEYPNMKGITQWRDLAKIVCDGVDAGPPPRRPGAHKPKDFFNTFDDSEEVNILKNSLDNDEALLKLQFDHGTENEEIWENQDPEYSDYEVQTAPYHAWYGSALWPALTVVVVTLAVLLLAASIAVSLAKRRGRGPVIRPPMILRQGLVDNKNCGLVYKPLQEEIATPHMPKRGSFYSSSTFHYDKIVPESV